MNNDSDSEADSIEIRIDLSTWTVRRTILVSIVIVLLLLWLFAAIKSNDTAPSNQAWRDIWTVLLTRPVRKQAQDDSIPLSEKYLVSTRLSPQGLGPVPVLWVRPIAKRQDDSPIDWLGIGASSGTVPTNVLMIHGGLTTMDHYYPDAQYLAKTFGVHVGCIEFPGFGSRLTTSQLSEESLTQDYALEVLEIMRDHFKWKWSDTVIWMNCLGVAIGLRVLWTGYQRGQLLNDEETSVPAALFCTKSQLSFRHVMRNAFGRVMGNMICRLPPKDMLDAAPFEHSGRASSWLTLLYPLIKCPVLINVGEQDRICPVKDARALASRFVKSPKVRVRVMPNTGHTCKLWKIAKYEYDLTVK
jgi:pimeloyl-ACP methyl ester carboxylesterase